MIDNPPKKLEDAVAYIIRQLSFPDKKVIAACNTCSRMIGLTHHGLGTCIRNELGLWGDNKELLEDLQTYSEEEFAVIGDDACAIVLEKIWEKLRGNNE